MTSLPKASLLARNLSPQVGRSQAKRHALSFRRRTSAAAPASLSKARLEPEMVEAVHRADFDAARLVVARQLQCHDGAGAALGPDLAVEGGERGDRLAVDADDRVAGAHARLLGRPARRHPGDDERAADLVRRD